MKKIQIQIKKCGSGAWYGHLIGRVLTVEKSNEHEGYLYVIWKSADEKEEATKKGRGLDGYGYSWLYRNDCGPPTDKIKVRSIRCL